MELRHWPSPFELRQQERDRKAREEDEMTAQLRQEDPNVFKLLEYANGKLKHYGLQVCLTKRNDS